jgi:hypothetical protein
MAAGLISLRTKKSRGPKSAVGSSEVPIAWHSGRTSVPTWMTKVPSISGIATFEYTKIVLLYLLTSKRLVWTARQKEIAPRLMAEIDPV